MARDRLEPDHRGDPVPRGVRLRALPRAAAARAQRRRRARRPRRVAAAAAGERPLGDREAQPRLQPDDGEPPPVRAGPRAAARGGVARPAHAARAAAARHRDGREGRGDARGHGRRHRRDGPHHRSVPRVRAHRSRRRARAGRRGGDRRRVRRPLRARGPRRPVRGRCRASGAAAADRVLAPGREPDRQRARVRRASGRRDDLGRRAAASCSTSPIAGRASPRTTSSA